MSALSYLSLCSGIEAATVAWSPLGWKSVAFAAVEPFASAVLAYHYPDVPNVGDMTKINGADYRGLVNVLVGGTPCQSFSIAGLRRGLEDERGNLALEFVRLADECDPAFVVWENVPGVLSTKDNAFGCFLGALAGEGEPLVLPQGWKWATAGCVAGSKRTIAWRVLDAQYFGVAQRRRRVFLVASPPERGNPLEILFEWEGLRRDSPPCREKGQGASASSEMGIGKPCNKSHWEGGPHPTLNSGEKSGGIGASDQALFSQRGAYLVPQIVQQAISSKWAKGYSGPAGDEHHNLIVMASQQGGAEIGENLCPAITAAAGTSGNNQPVVLLDSADKIQPNRITGTLAASGAGLNRPAGQCNEASFLCLDNRMGGVRRLTPLECERLQGFPDGWTLIPWKKGLSPDTLRYKAIGNSMAVPVMRWIGERIARYA